MTANANCNIPCPWPLCVPQHKPTWRNITADNIKAQPKGN